MWQVEAERNDSLSENRLDYFVLYFQFQEPNHKSIWLHYVLVIQSSQYNKESVMEAPFDQTARFISQCANNSFYLDTFSNTTRKTSADEGKNNVIRKYNGVQSHSVSTSLRMV